MSRRRKLRQYESTRPEELRLLEALLFAAGEPLDEAMLARRLPNGVNVKAALAQLKDEYATRGVNLVRVGKKWTFRTAIDLVLAADEADRRDPQAFARGNRDARDCRLSPASDARRDRGNSRRGDGDRHARRAAQDRLDSSARPPQGAGATDHLRHDGSVPLAFRARGGRRPAGPRRTQGRRACWRAICLPVSPCRFPRTTQHCATTRIRSIRAISIWAWRRRRRVPKSDRARI